MKTILKILIILGLGVIVAANLLNKTQDRFYYAYDEKIFLSEIEDKIIVQFTTNKKSNSRFLLSEFPDLKEEEIVWKNDSTIVLKTRATERVKIQKDLGNREDVASINPLYKSVEGLEMGFTDRFIIELKDNVSIKALQKLNTENKVEVIKANEHYLLLKVPKGVDALSIANLYYESGLVYYSHPDFYADIAIHQAANDPYYNNQFYLHNTGQQIADGRFGTADADIDAPEAWTVTTGNSNIIVAVIDYGVTSNHVDLPNTRQVRLNGSNFGNGNPNNPSPTGDDNHGNACAGIIAATRNNNIGISGIAPGVKNNAN